MNSTTTRLILIRHGEVEERYHRVFGGRIDMGLSELGCRQAAALAEHFGPGTLDVIYASPMRRAQQTLEPLIRHSRSAPITEHDLREVDFGDWTGLKWEEVRERFNVSAFDWLAQIERGAIQNAECGARLRSRIEPCLQAILERHVGQTVGIICHGGVIRMLLSLLIDVPLAKTASFEIDYASVSEITVAGPRREIQLLNFAPWKRGLAPS
jgi:broad specificity phosphatase PhoE